jgi:Protein of unknown function (DUF3311)
VAVRAIARGASSASSRVLPARRVSAPRIEPMFEEGPGAGGGTGGRAAPATTRRRLEVVLGRRPCAPTLAELEALGATALSPAERVLLAEAWDRQLAATWAAAIAATVAATPTPRSPCADVVEAETAPAHRLTDRSLQGRLVCGRRLIEVLRTTHTPKATPDAQRSRLVARRRRRIGPSPRHDPDIERQTGRARCEVHHEGNSAGSSEVGLMDRTDVDPATDPATARADRPVRRYFYVLLLAPFVGTLWVSTYAHDAPRLFGFPFFYWYQLAWVFAAAGLTAFVYLVTTPRRRRGRPPGGGESADVYPPSSAPSQPRSDVR